MSTLTDPRIVQMGDPVHHRGVTIAPLFPRRDPIAAYVSLERGLARGLVIDELDDAGDVSELRVVNRAADDVLLYEGQELEGAKQDRILDRTVLVAAGATLVVPVSCVEQGRWRRTSAAFSAAPRASHPNLRRRKAERLLASAEPGAAQSVVWDEVAAKAERLGVRAPTGAQGAAFVEMDEAIAGRATAFRRLPGQCGAVFGLAGRPVCVDMVSRPEVWADIHDKLLAGYLLDALEPSLETPTAEDDLAAFVDRACGLRPEPHPSVGAGRPLRVADAGVVGSGLEVDGELVQLSAHAR